jgi:hypothetical protein
MQPPKNHEQCAECVTRMVPIKYDRHHACVDAPAKGFCKTTVNLSHAK